MKQEIIKQIDESIISIIGSETILGFQKAYLVANAINELKTLLTPEYMAPIMALQGNRLGFKTDKDKAGGYGVDIVKNCVIEAVLMGLQPTGNHFNIIAGNTYPTKEGCGYLLNNFKGLSYDLVCSLPRVNNDKTSAAVEVTITWALNGEKKEKVIPIPIKMDAYTSVDALIGKATRKGRAWLLSRISGMEITDGDVLDVTHVEIKKTSINEVDSEKEKERLVQFINNTASLDDLQGFDTETLFEYNLVDLVDSRIEEFKETLKLKK